MKSLLIILCLTMVATSQAQTRITCDLTDSLISQDSVRTFRDSFETVFETNYAAVKFKRAHLNALYSNNSNTNVRMYFTYSGGDDLSTLPGIALLAYSKNNCLTDLTDTIITSYTATVAGKMEPMDSLIENEIAQWKNLYSLAGLQGFEEILGYNFPWETIWDACGTEDDDLRVIFAIFENNETEKNEIHMILTNPNREVNLSEVYLDFSSPCPRLCGKNVIE